jgi:hypothetical protein
MGIWFQMMVLCLRIIGDKGRMKEKLTRFELLVLIEKNESTNERKLKTEIEKLFSKNPQLREINLVQFKKSQ